MKNPLTYLFKEHQNITRLVHFYQKISHLYKTDEKKYIEIMTDLLNFFKNYADRYHHAKEEDTLFPKMCEKNQLLADGMVKEMLENHSDFRTLMGEIGDALGRKDFEKATTLTNEYSEGLLNHIAAENGELFHIAEELFTEEELETIYFRFEDIDRYVGLEHKEQMEKLHIKLKSML
jgi:hemerythrin-like domain-containing protein